MNIEKDEIICTDKYLSLVSENIAYIKTDILHHNCNNIIWRDNFHSMRIAKIWITGHSDYPITKDMFNRYNNNCDIWFAINKDIENKKIHSLPLGITNYTNETDLHPIYGDLDIMCKVMMEPHDIKHLIYLNFNINTYPSERQRCYEYFSNKSYVTIGKIENTLEGRTNYLREIRKHKFVLCPRGNGIDTHRLWETLYMGSIPIVKRCPAMNEFIDLPILFIDDWSDIIDENFLETKYTEITSKSWNLDKLKFSYWKKIITEISNNN